LKKSMLREEMILSEDLHYFQVIDDPEEVVRHIKRFVIV